MLSLFGEDYWLNVKTKLIQVYQWKEVQAKLSSVSMERICESVLNIRDVKRILVRINGRTIKPI